MRLTITKGSFDDWWLIERAEHDGREWIDRHSGYGASFMRSARIGNADVEGSSEEMLSIAKAIDERRSEHFKRCAVVVNGDRVQFYSPRNTTERGEPCTLSEADALSALIKATVNQ